MGKKKKCGVEHSDEVLLEMSGAKKTVRQQSKTKVSEVRTTFKQNAGLEQPNNLPVG